MQTENPDSPQTEHKVELSASEIANIWQSYMNDTMAICTIGTFLSNVKDQEVRSVLEYAMQTSQAHAQKLKSFFNEEQFPVPDGFSVEHDVNSEAPRLFTDDFYLFYIQNIGKIGLTAYTINLSNSARLDMCEYYTECLNESSTLLNKATEIMLKKGTFIRSPFIPKPKVVEYVQKQSYLAGWFVTQRRPLNAIEIANIYYNLIQNQLGRTLLIGFSQVAKSEQVRDYMVRGRNIADKHVEVFGSILSKEYLPSASAWSTLPIDSTIAPFSDKLMMGHVAALNMAGIGHYGMSIGQSPRRDLGTHYARLLTEITAYAEDGANIMIDNGWLEQPPQATDREKLASDEK
ncbi:DUF3231 family protein [Bacillus sp. 1NLA3E]|uniref:DUF3231 family protein n=1 Tax=Bacillus sp. 1NLA3E TaxID=666686 RepID=UPI000247E2DF|nr:DUF3231 family protein [Bacillus sp. 1NLA3E]AGK53207.1 hypothetical protein B1NLA3E_07225 [Bacillus sp. 1NLA3E]